MSLQRTAHSNPGVLALYEQSLASRGFLADPSSSAPRGATGRSA
ncbi:MAG: hypothetical protein OEW96_12325 [Betaproteobacteria bacterium]|nr:hypothetical protein [Betaproteobacteria bacterium]MDH5212445.1 hypothetical protein [Betaproteobacteria bacterium]